MNIIRFRRAAAKTPGKHGFGDWRVEINGTAPEHSELVFALGMMLIAEDRYSAPGNHGRYLLWYYIDRLLAAKTPERVLAVAEDCQLSVSESPARRREVLA